MDKNSTSARSKRLWYRKPASVWEEALPVGNGRLGGMVFGGADEELIQVNEDTLWSGFPRDTVNYEARRYLAPAKDLAAKGQYTGAESLIEAKMLGRRTESYQPLGDLHLSVTNAKDINNYARELNLDTAMATVSFEAGGDYQVLFSRVGLLLGSGADGDVNADKPTDERLEHYRKGNIDLPLESLLFHYGRYLMIAGSRPGTQALNLQGIWNPHMQPPWNSNYTTNINAEMNYWPAEVCALGECHEPLLDLIHEVSVTGSRTAAIHYGARGWTVHHNTDLWRMSTPSDGRAMWGFWPMGGVWLSRHLWERYAFRPDLDFLRDEAYPLLKGAAIFCLDWLVERADGKWTTSLSTSPENVFLTSDGAPCSVAEGSAMDMALIDELFTHCLQAAEILDTDAAFREELASKRELLAHPGIGPDGRIREWSEDFAENEPGHRHVSHLYALYPGNAINQNDSAELVKAAASSLETRIKAGSGHTGWSTSWILNLYARLADSANAYRCVRRILSDSSLPNLFGNHPPFQIDGNFGYAAGVAEMLLQSHLDGIQLLPTLPDSWSEGEVRGLKARGGFVIDMKWSAGELTQASITSTHGQVCRLIGKGSFSTQKPDGTKVDSGTEFATTAGETYTITRSLEESSI